VTRPAARAAPNTVEQLPAGGNANQPAVLSGPPERRVVMLWTIVVILIILWLLGFTIHIGGALIHLLLVIAVIVILVNLISGRRG
jgi:hypothetical protein